MSSFLFDGFHHKNFLLLYCLNYTISVLNFDKFLPVMKALKKLLLYLHSVHYDNQNL